MSDSYQAVYDAACRKIQGCDTGSAIESALREAFGDGFHVMQRVGQAYIDAALEQARPSTIYRPRIAIDGNMWAALYGDNIQEGVAGFGESPALAMADFDKNWNAKLATKEPK